MIKHGKKKTDKPDPPKRARSFRSLKQVIKDGDWTRFNYSDYCQYLKKWACRTMVIENNLIFNLLESICHIEFSQLRRLFLSRNCIESIQSICKMVCPHLQYLDLSSNRIITLKAFKRVCFEELQTLHLADNPIYDSDASALQAFMPNLAYFSLDYYTYQKPTLQDVCPLVKLQAKSIKQLYFDSCKRIIQPKLMKVLAERFIGAEIAEELMMDVLSEQDDEQPSQLDEDQSEQLIETVPGLVKRVFN